jgi:hypothetical protein
VTKCQSRKKTGPEGTTQYNDCFQRLCQHLLLRRTLSRKAESK